MGKYRKYKIPNVGSPNQNGCINICSGDLFFCFCLRNEKNEKTNQKTEKRASEEVFSFSRFFGDFDLRNTFLHAILIKENPVSSFLFKKRALILSLILFKPMTVYSVTFCPLVTPIVGIYLHNSFFVEPKIKEKLITGCNI